MKKISVAILAFLYLGTSMGATIQLHYCMGRFVDWTLRYDTHSKCGRCGMEKKAGSAKGCCRDEYKQVRIDNDQKLSENCVKLNETNTEAILIVPGLSTLVPLGSDRNFVPINSLPPPGNVSLNILHCVFRT